MTTKMDFTVVIPSRNRPILLRKAIDSVLSQSHDSFEVLVVNDGSDGENEIAYQQLAEELHPKVRFLNLEKAPNGHGQSGSINRGVGAANGEYVCFLDDDDYWTDNQHLQRAANALKVFEGDIYYSNQDAYVNDKKVEGPVWIEGLEKIASAAGRKVIDNCYSVTISDLMQCHGFAHLNTTIVRKSLYEDINGMDENIRYECDWDFFLRTIDKAKTIVFSPCVTSYHKAPDTSKTENMSTAVSMLQKLLFRTYVLDKAIMLSSSKDIINKSILHKTYTLKHMSQQLINDGKLEEAVFYASQAKTNVWDLKWYLKLVSLRIRSILQKG